MARAPQTPLCSRIIPDEDCNLAMVDGELKINEANLDLSPPAFTGCKHPMLKDELKPGRLGQRRWQSIPDIPRIQFIQAPFPLPSFPLTAFAKPFLSKALRLPCFPQGCKESEGRVLGGPLSEALEALPLLIRRMLR
ncbi:unnamed protein product [Symbiodinium natans]|uniref:Uncharacterized protein n=1 Tax=Symbiodinium natans TaxID=878477 RepID=A0A812TXH6_9DINO|nr:unnamed protein product [Symbiodinium natans]